MKKIDYDLELGKIRKIVEMEDKNQFEQLRKKYVEEALEEDKAKLENYKQIKKWKEMMEKNCTPSELIYSDTYMHTLSYINKISKPIDELILNELVKSGFNKEEEGTKYLADLTTMLYLENKMLNNISLNENYVKYWDLNDNDNVHFLMLNNNTEEVISKIQESINNSDRDESIADIAYSLADQFIQYKILRDNNKTTYNSVYMYNKRRK